MKRGYNDFPSFLGSEKHEGNVHTIPSVLSPNRVRSTKKSLFGQPLSSIFEDNKLPTPIIVSIILGVYNTFVLSKLFDKTEECLDNLSMRVNHFKREISSTGERIA